MKKLAVISMFVAATGLLLAGTGTAQGSMNSQDQYGEHPGETSFLEIDPAFPFPSFEADNHEGMIEMRVDFPQDTYLFPYETYLAVLLLSTSGERFSSGYGDILVGARLAGYGVGNSAGYSADLDLSGSDYEGDLWLQAVIFVDDGLFVTNIKRISMRDETDRTDPIGGPSDPDGDGGSANVPSEPTGTDENQNAGLETGNGDQAKA